MKKIYFKDLTEKTKKELKEYFDAWFDKNSLIKNIFEETNNFEEMNDFEYEKMYLDFVIKNSFDNELVTAKTYSFNWSSDIKY